jgi:hypothetical protein
VDPLLQEHYQRMSTDELWRARAQLTEALQNHQRQEHEAPGSTVGLYIGHAIASREDDPEPEYPSGITLQQRIVYIDQLLAARAAAAPGTVMVTPGTNMQMTVVDDEPSTAASASAPAAPGTVVATPGTNMQMTVDDEPSTAAAYPPDLTTGASAPAGGGPSAADYERAGLFDEAVATPAPGPSAPAGTAPRGPRRGLIGIVAGLLVLAGVILAIVLSVTGGPAPKSGPGATGGTSAGSTSGSSPVTSASAAAQGGLNGVAASADSTISTSGSDVVYSIRVPGATGPHTVVVNFSGPGLPPSLTMTVPASGYTQTFTGVLKCGTTWGATIASIDGKALTGYVPDKTVTNVCVNG